MNYFADTIEKLTEDNASYRKVIFTGSFSQLVLMNILPGQDIGEEVHEGHDQFIRIEAGTAEFLLGEEKVIGTDGFAVVIPSGLRHNVRNIGSDNLKLYTIYSPQEHSEGTVQETKPE